MPAEQDVDPATIETDEEDEARLPDLPDDPSDTIADAPLAIGRAAIEHAVRHAPTSPGVYRMMNAAHDVLYVGKAKNVRKRLSSYARPTGQVMRIARMIAATATVEIVSTETVSSCSIVTVFVSGSPLTSETPGMADRDFSIVAVQPPQ